MFESALGLVVTAAFVLPGFIVQLTARKRLDAPTSGVDTELVLRALSWALLYQGAILAWTAYLARRLDDPRQWTEFVPQIALYATVGLVLVPILIGLLLAAEIRGVDAAGDGWRALIARMLGAPASADAWVRGLVPLLTADAWVIVRSRQGRTIAGFFGAASVWPLDGEGADIFLQEEWTVDPAGNFLARVDPRRGVWISRDQIESVHVSPGH